MSSAQEIEGTFLYGEHQKSVGAGGTDPGEQIRVPLVLEGL